MAFDYDSRLVVSAGALKNPRNPCGVTEKPYASDTRARRVQWQGGTCPTWCVKTMPSNNAAASHVQSLVFLYTQWLGQWKNSQRCDIIRAPCSSRPSNIKLTNPRCNHKNWSYSIPSLPSLLNDAGSSSRARHATACFARLTRE